jgi:hypothetical protein
MGYGIGLAGMLITHTLSHHIMRKNSLKSPYLDIRYKHKAKIKEES